MKIILNYLKKKIRRENSKRVRIKLTKFVVFTFTLNVHVEI